MSSQDVLLMEEYEYQEITDSQEKLLAILPIPSAILSIFGSVTIITITFKSRHKRAWTPYHGLLTAMSGLNVIFSISIAAGSYLFPKDTSNKVWAFGNDASCTATGFLTQFSFSVLLYQAMLGFYFLASTRYGLSDKEIAARFEPSMHCLAVGYPLVTAFLGLYLEVYGERQGFLSCWVKTCGFDEFGEREDCTLPIIDIVFGRIIGLFVFFSLIINNIVIWRYARKQMRIQEVKRQTRRLSMGQSGTLVTVAAVKADQQSLRQSQRLQLRNSIQSELDIKAREKRRLNYLSTQAIFFVGSIFLCNIIPFTLRYLVANHIEFGLVARSTSSYVEEMEIPYRNFPLLVAQAILYPLQGFVNMLVYLRPSYTKNRRKFPEETRLWAFRRAIFGESITPALSSPDEEDTKEKTQRFGTAGGSSATESPKTYVRPPAIYGLSSGTIRSMERACSSRELLKSNMMGAIDESIDQQLSETDSMSMLTPSILNDDTGSEKDRASSKSTIIQMDGSVTSFQQWFHGSYDR